MKLLKLWPGLEYLARHGSFRAWLAAMFYAFFAMAVLSLTLVWDSLIPSNSQNVLLVLFIASWFFGLFLSARFEKTFLESQKLRQKESVTTDILPLAQTECLRRNYYESERLLRERLVKFPEDVPARFFLVTVLKYQKRLEEAHEQVAVLEQNPKLGSWGLDLLREKENLKE